MSEVLNITVYGSNTAGQHMISSRLKDFLSKAEIAYNVTEESNVDEFINKKIKSVPSIQINGGEIIPIKNDEHFSVSLRDAIQRILRKRNYGTLTKYLVPTDFSKSATNAFQYGLSMAKDLDAVVKAVHIYMPKAADLDGTFFVDGEVEVHKKRQLKELVDAVNQDWMGDVLETALVDQDFKIGFPAKEIMETAKEEGFDMIIMGSEGDTGVIKQVFGSVSVEVMSYAECPVLVVPPLATFKGIHNILFACENSEIDNRALNRLVEFARPHEANLHLVKVSKDKGDGCDYDLIESLKNKYSKSKIFHESYQHENVLEGLNEYAINENIDLITMTRRKRSLINELFHKSLTKKMSIVTSTPLLIYHV